MDEENILMCIKGNRFCSALGCIIRHYSYRHEEVLSSFSSCKLSPQGT